MGGDEGADTLVLGIGNLLWADDGFGVRAAEALAERYDLPDGVRVVDGGTQGLYLTPLVCTSRRLLVFDAIDYGDEPGTMRLLRDGEVPRYAGVRKMSLHQTGFQEVLAAADLLGRLPRAMLLIGVQPAGIDEWGAALSPSVAGRIAPALDAAVAQLAEWGVPPVRRAGGRKGPDDGGLMLPCLSRTAYERDAAIEKAAPP